VFFLSFSASEQQKYPGIIDADAGKLEPSGKEVEEMEFKKSTQPVM
jgi:hypothetical protein